MNDLVEQHLMLCNQLNAIYEQKNKAYGNSFGETYDKLGIISCITRISDKYQNDKDDPYYVDLIKMPHHGSYTGTLYRFVRTFMPKYAIISCGENNMYGHPHRETMDLLNNKELGAEVYRTDKDGDILVKSDGKTISVEKSK